MAGISCRCSRVLAALVLLLLARQTVLGPWRWSNLALAGVTGLLLLSGAADVCGIVLITTGLYALWLLSFETARWRCRISAAAGLSAAWLIGFLIAAPYLIPLADYFRRQPHAVPQHRPRGAAARRNAGSGSRRFAEHVWHHARGFPPRGSRQSDRSSSGAYAGLLAVFWLAPLAWGDTKRRKEALFFVLLAILQCAGA